MAKRKSEQLADLRSLGKESYISQRGINSLIQTLRQSGIPEQTSRIEQYRARKDLSSTLTPYGPLVNEIQLTLIDQPADKAKSTIGLVNPMAFVQYQAAHSEHYAKVLSQSLISKPPSPSNLWKVVPMFLSNWILLIS